LKKFALISVSDKTGVADFAKNLVGLDYNILATGNTAKLIKENGVECTEISDVTNFPEVFSGRVKTLHPLIFGGILFRRDHQSDIDEAASNSISPIDIVCVNLYPFPQVVNNADIDLQTKIENIDIGGPSLIRAAAKNYKYVSVLTNPNQYGSFIEELKSGSLSLDTRTKLASEAFTHTSFYDTIIADFFESEFDLPKEYYRVNLPKNKELRYGENPHQKAFIYGDFEKYYRVIHGKELSYNNIIDLHAAVELVKELDEFSCTIIKHTNPCGAATSDSVISAYEKALSCDPTSSFGGIVAFNNKVDKQTAEKLNEIFLEIVTAPDFDDDALEILQKKKNRRLVKYISSRQDDKFIIKNIPGSLIVQEKDNSVLNDIELKLVTEKSYSEDELKDLKFAWVICKHVKSNAIVYVKDQKAIGVGAGQMSRIDSSKIAAIKAKEFGHDLKGAVAASDAFFPFPDGVIEIASSGITSIIQPGGSVRDNEVIEAANKNNISMIFTGIRNFKH
jgi:phosphoribosylaminoimidazolecarboxamide formyltransferase/IMP cyclohydrolase